MGQACPNTDHRLGSREGLLIAADPVVTQGHWINTGGSKDVVILPSSNGVPVEFTDRYFAPMQDGYVLLRQVLDPAEVLRIRAEYFAAFPPEYFKAGTQPGEGVFSGTVPGGVPEYGVRGHPAYDFVRGPVYEAFAAQPAL